MDDPVRGALREAADTGLMPPGAGILMAVSGGADSLALLHGAAEVAAPYGWSLSVAHVEHGWRGRDAERDVAFVREHARRLRLPFALRRVDARSEARRLRLSPEAGARHARYGALTEIAREAGATLIATAHQREDALESYLIARERRAGLGGLGGPRRSRDDGVVRPLLDVGRRDILAFLAARGLPHRRDASNGDLRLLRNGIRRRLAEAVRRDGPAALEALHAEAAAWRRRRETVDRELAERILPALRLGPNETLADAALLQASAPDLQRRALELASVPFARSGRAPFTGREREEILRRLRSGGDFRFEAGRRIRFERRGDALRVRRVGA